MTVLGYSIAIYPTTSLVWPVSLSPEVSSSTKTENPSAVRSAILKPAVFPPSQVYIATKVHGASSKESPNDIDSHSSSKISSPVKASA